VKPQLTTEIESDTPGLDIARPLADSMDQAIGEATSVMGAVVTELMRRSLRGGISKVGEQLQGYVAEQVDATIGERLPGIEHNVMLVAESTAQVAATKVVAEEIHASEERTREATTLLGTQIEETRRHAEQTTAATVLTLTGQLQATENRLSLATRETADGLTQRIQEVDRRAEQATATTTEALTSKIEETERRVNEATQTEINQRLEHHLERSKKGALLLKSRLKSLESTVTERTKRYDLEHESHRAELKKHSAGIGAAHAKLSEELEQLRTENESLRERLTELERPRGLGRLWAWLFRRKKKETVERKKEETTEE
jgi:chromosome segregation ATPase